MVSKNIEDFSVVIRCHPPRSRDPEEQTKMAVSIDSSQNLIKLKDPNPDKQSELSQEFSFERIYDWNSSQKDFFDQVAKPLIQDVVEGYNGTILAHGETGSGKTYTIQGNLAEKDQYGIIPRAAEEIFKTIEANTSKDKQYFVYCSFIMIYSQQMADLLSPIRADLALRTKERGVYIKGATRWPAKNYDELLQLYSRGCKTRDREFRVAGRGQSSLQSFLIFSVRIESFELNSEGKVVIRASTLHLVDTSGSEKIPKISYESAAVPKSLSAFASVIMALANEKSKVIPYKDSNLTRLLQDSLGGNAKTVFIATIIPDSAYFDRSLSTLRFAACAKRVQNAAKVNIITKEVYKSALAEDLQSNLEALKAEITPSHNSSIEFLMQYANIGTGTGDQINQNGWQRFLDTKEENFVTIEKKAIENVIDSTMRVVGRLDMIDERKNDIWRQLKEKEKECHKIIEHRIMAELLLYELLMKGLMRTRQK